MRKEDEKEILASIESGHINEYIDAHYWELERATITDLLKEVLYLLPQEFYDDLHYNLTEYRDFGKEEE